MPLQFVPHQFFQVVIRLLFLVVLVAGQATVHTYSQSSEEGSAQAAATLTASSQSIDTSLENPSAPVPEREMDPSALPHTDQPAFTSPTPLLPALQLLPQLQSGHPIASTGNADSDAPSPVLTRASVHTSLAARTTLVGSRPSGTS